MRFNSSLLTSVAAFVFAFVPSVAAQPACSEAERFGVLSLVPSTVAQGDSFTINLDLTCATFFQVFPVYLDYYIEVLTDNNGHEPPVLLARHTYNTTAAPSADTFTAQVPYWDYFSHAQYSIVIQNSNTNVGTMGNTVIAVGSTSAPINITGNLIA
ncbi:hypothetical protein B0H11DRAFT_2018023 [Mycena galericulata]|nr:hypothetical protein B0H11DRAFT_2018023 [Mycena galericulata]